MRSYFEVNDQTKWDLAIAFQLYYNEYKSFAVAVAKMKEDLINLTNLPNVLQSASKRAKSYIEGWEKHKRNFRDIMKEVENQDKSKEKRKGKGRQLEPTHEASYRQLNISNIEKIDSFQNINGDLIQDRNGSPSRRNIGSDVLNEESGQDNADFEDADSDASFDIEFPSDLSKDYHPLVDEELYTLPELVNIETEEAKWLIKLGSDTDAEELNVIKELTVFRAVSTNIHPTSLSDLRLLSLTAYMPEPAHIIIMNELLVEPPVIIDNQCIIWCNELSKIKMPNWKSVQRITVPILHEALNTVDEKPINLIIANILHRAGLLFANGVPESDLEDSFVHNFIANLFENVFQSESILSCNWANGQIGGKRKIDKEEPIEFKPDYVLFVTQRTQRLDLTCAEAKSPSNRSSFPKFDLVKTGQEMRWMYNKLVREGVPNPTVGGILISGHDMYTFKMDMVDKSVYRMTELSKTLIFRSLNELTLLPVIVSNLIQLKQVTLSTASIVKDRLREKAKGIPPNPQPPLSWLQDNTIDLVKRQKKN